MAPTRMFLALSVLGGCTDYGFSKSDAAGDADTASTTPDGTVTDRPERDRPDSGVPDSGVPDTGVPDSGIPDTGSADVCWEPEDGYTSNAAARLFSTDGSVPVTVTLQLSDTGYSDDLYLDSPASVFLVHAWEAPPGTALTVGPYPAGAELVFGIGILDTGDHWQSGPAMRNDDGVVHVAVTYEGSCSWLIGFEDLRGGGDLDFNDVVLRVQGMLKQEL